MASSRAWCSEPDALQSAGNAQRGDIMRKLLIAAAFTLCATPGLAGEPVKLSSAQMDKVTAGGFSIVDVCEVCTNIAYVAQANVNTSASSWVKQKNVAVVKQEIN
jgi:hypothetical protein